MFLAIDILYCIFLTYMLLCAFVCCAICCTVLCCVVLCCVMLYILCCVVLYCAAAAVLCCHVQCCAVLCCHMYLLCYNACTTLIKRWSSHHRTVWNLTVKCCFVLVWSSQVFMNIAKLSPPTLRGDSNEHYNWMKLREPLLELIYNYYCL